MKIHHDLAKLTQDEVCEFMRVTIAVAQMYERRIDFSTAMPFQEWERAVKEKFNHFMQVTATEYER